jgi:cyclic beta-1,2-glucan synthetase
MKVNTTVINESLIRIKTDLFGSGFSKKYYDGEQPLRSELFSSDQMEIHGTKLAALHRAGTEKTTDQYLLTRLAENEEVLITVRDIITESVKANRQITPAGEWLLDNFYLIEEHIHTGKRHLPKGYSRELPRLLDGLSIGLPRVYDIALETISHGDGRVDPESLARFVAAYQTVSPLKLGELWAIPIMLRLALIENLRRVATRIADNSIDGDNADTWADLLMETAEKDPKSLILVIADMARSKPPMNTTFVSEFARRLQGQSSALALPLTWIEQQLSDSGLTIERLIQVGNQQLAADQLTISNSIDSLRFLGAMDWKEFVEKMSIIEQILRNDPAGSYSKMDFGTRDNYRRIIERIAKLSPLSEVEVASKAMFLARQNATNKGSEERTAHVGYFLVDKGLSELERLVNVRFSVLRSLTKVGTRFNLVLFSGSILLITSVLTWGFLSKSYADGVHGWLLFLMGILLFFSSSHLAVPLVNWVATILATPKPLPRMDFSHGIPPESRTLVVIPSMLMSIQNIEELTEALEVRFLANRDKNLHFALLTDFKDADKENMIEDDQLIKLAEKNIEELNEKYKDTRNETFFLFHRPRVWNKSERIWMGYERKRGKLSELNSFLRGGSDYYFTTIVGNTDVLSGVKYVITLDTDTQLPRDSARQFVGTMAHPLNRAIYDENKQRVCEGYGILQPRVAVSLPVTNMSIYARLYGSEPGIDPYTRAVSDVYQDVFGEGSFIGKGIYDVDIFNQAFNGRFPENRILSHDLLEGCYVRSGLISDVQLFEEYPSNYMADVNRRYRWIRGDWQIIKWMFPRVPCLNGRLHKNPLSALSRWKIFDNLRRSLTPIALTLLLLLGWSVLSNALFWTMSVIGIIIIPSLIISVLDLLNKQTDVLPRQHITASIRSAGLHFSQAAFMVACLPHEAYYSLDAISRTLWRLLISHKGLLEWNLSGKPDRIKRPGFMGIYFLMWISPAISFVSIVALAISQPIMLAVVWPIPALWSASPFIAWSISLTIIRRKARLSDYQIMFLRELSRKTWGFFEAFVGPKDNWLPPDNFQENPVPVVAHRTSPTNMGLALLANLSAYDFGYIPSGDLVERTAQTFRTMENMKRYRGHFYNWYDTITLDPLQPPYISSVDSGNLAGYLMVLRPGLLSIPDQKILDNRIFEAVDDTLRILLGLAGKTSISGIIKIRKELKVIKDSDPSTLVAVRLWLVQLSASADEIKEGLDSKTDIQALCWADSLIHQCWSFINELTFLAPWLLLPPLPDMHIKIPGIDGIPTLREISNLDLTLLSELGKLRKPDSKTETIILIDKLERAVSEASQRARERMETIEQLALMLDGFTHLEYDFLYDKGRHLLSVGYNVNERRRDSSYYDLLASEARFACFIGIAQGQIPQDSWFALGRLLTSTGGDPVLLSWSGSMFEYLMPLLVMPTYENTLLDQTYKTTVKRQIEYGKRRGTPWGISESGYNTVDVHLNYQYRAFGVPGMGLKRGLAEDLVIAPYASMLALMVDPEEACGNLERLAKQNMIGKYGFYEAIDYSSSRLPHGQSNMIIQSFMAHHEGMSLLSLAYLILDRPMQKRFESDQMFQATMLLLQERIPKATAFYSYTSGISEIHTISVTADMSVRVLKSPDTQIPEVHLLSNGRYNVMITNAGGGYSNWKDIAVTRWHEDTTCDNWGSFCYVRDLKTGEFWSTSYQPTLKMSDNYEAIFSKGRAEFRRRDNELDTHTEIVVSPEDDIELRRVRITNRSRLRRSIDVTSYAEVVLTSAVADTIHPAFSNLFVQTEIISDKQAILCTRRPRSVDEKVPWMFHEMTVHGADTGAVSFETDRMEFIGRGKSIVAPQAMTSTDKLSGNQGSVLDPIVAIRYHIMLDPEESAIIDIVTGISESRETSLSLVDKYQDRRLSNRVFELAWTYSQVVLRQINASEADAQLYGRLASSIIYANSSLRAGTNILSKNRRGQSGLWGYSISGDLPIVLLKIEDPGNINLVRQLVQAHAYWRLKGLAVDLVIWNEDHAGYRQLLNDQIMGLIAAGIEANIIDRPGGVFVRLADQISVEDRILIQTVARAVISDKRGTLAEQINRRPFTEVQVPMFKATRNLRPLVTSGAVLIPPSGLGFYNGLGGFTENGQEYVIATSRENPTPAPWVNVLANPHFGTVISESGASYTWSENAHELRLTPWNNDPVNDPCGEAIYIRDEETGNFWSPTPFPCCGTKTYISRHGFGYSMFEHIEDGIRSELCIYVAMDAPVKFSVLKIKNESGRQRNLSVTGYVEWVLGDLRPKSVMHITTFIDPKSGALFARNPYNSEFGERIAFFHTDDAFYTLTGDRTEFIGRNRSLRNPSTMEHLQLSGKVGSALDPCAAIQVNFELSDMQEHETIFRLGVGRNTDEAGKLVNQFRGTSAAVSSLETINKFWKQTLGSVQVETPDPSINVLTNGWLLYQTLACRMWARSGYYQSGGAFGFRDQLQDSMALNHSVPHLVRDHLLLCASRQFREGDVQHWWHPPYGRGVRTHCSDDFLWLPLVTCRYVIHTGDTGILDQPIQFIEGRPLLAEDDSYYDLPGRSEETGNLYQHCVRAILKGLSFGSHGLPLMGTGDWNDGMNMVGRKGKGESVWLGFFLYDVLKQFIKIAKLKEDLPFAERCKKEASKLRQNIEKNCWDGKWYLRAWFDDGQLLGSSSNPECQIDSVSQSWSVLSGAGDPDRSLLAMEAFNKHLVRREDGIIQLLDPPFDKSEMNPGYIKGYVPGVRENGGQYTHAAIWAAMAYASLGDNIHAWELLNIINPLKHSSTPEGVSKYKVEPYVVAADVYAVSPHTGHGGWTWYTGSAGLMYRLILESLLGLRLEVDKLFIAPCLPADWGELKIKYRYRETYYLITIIQKHEDQKSLRIIIDGKVISNSSIHLIDDQGEHSAEVIISLGV